MQLPSLKMQVWNDQVLSSTQRIGCRLNELSSLVAMAPKILRNAIIFCYGSQRLSWDGLVLSLMWQVTCRLSSVTLIPKASVVNSHPKPRWSGVDLSSTQWINCRPISVERFSLTQHRVNQQHTESKFLSSNGFEVCKCKDGTVWFNPERSEQSADCSQFS